MAKGSSGFDSGGGNGIIDRNAKEREITGISEGKIDKSSRRYMPATYRAEVLEAKDIGNGKLELSAAEPYSEETSHTSGRWTQVKKYKLKAGADEHRNFFGINWENVKSVSGQTFNIKDEIKKRGFKWDGQNKIWVKSV